MHQHSFIHRIWEILDLGSQSSCGVIYTCNAEGGRMRSVDIVPTVVCLYSTVSWGGSLLEHSGHCWWLLSAAGAGSGKTKVTWLPCNVLKPVAAVTALEI